MATNLISFVILCILLYGRSLRFKNLRWHIRLMLTAFAADFALVFVLAVHRRALSKVTLTMPWTLKIHVPIAVLTLVLYILAVWTGYRLYRGHPVRARLRALDRVLIPSRILTLVTSLIVYFFPQH